MKKVLIMVLLTLVIITSVSAVNLSLMQYSGEFTINEGEIYVYVKWVPSEHYFRYLANQFAESLGTTDISWRYTHGIGFDIHDRFEGDMGFHVNMEGYTRYEFNYAPSESDTIHVAVLLPERDDEFLYDRFGNLMRDKSASLYDEYSSNAFKDNPVEYLFFEKEDI